MGVATEPTRIASFVGGDWRAEGEERLDTNPARPEEVVATYPLATARTLEQAIDAASAAFPGWRGLTMFERAAVLVGAAALLEQRAETLAVELTREQGKTLTESRGEVGRAVEILRFNASLASARQGEEYASARPGERILTTRAPIGPIAVITPWNVPIAIPAWKLAPALLYGNTVVWKPARLVPLLAFRLMQALEEAGLPPGVCNLVIGDTSVGDRLLSDPRIHACSFTGSTEVGRRLIALGAAHGIKVQAEMGGKNAAIVLDDADLDWAVDQVLSASMYSTGQRCTATSRALVARSRHDEFLARLCERAEAIRVGDPLLAETQVGPLASDAQLRSVVGYFRAAREEGGEVLTGGEALEDPSGGYYVPPTVVAGVGPGDRVFEEEVFGPLVAVAAVDSDGEAIELANRGRYGLSGAIFSRDLERVMAVIDQLDVGVLHVNSESCGADPHVPFGGVKDSGTSQREMGTVARDFFTELKTVYLRGGRPR
ncbi:MAG: aldehyde dehydrogenase family protein [Actinobacteria bacterium]|nr:aldehyde dehydrogenase family protein [Actinomycetota bacterium]